MEQMPAWTIGLIAGLACWGGAAAAMMLHITTEMWFGLLSRPSRVLHAIAGTLMGLSPVAGLAAGLVAWLVR